MTASRVQIGISQDYLETSKLTSAAGIVHREGTFTASPTNVNAVREVDLIPSAARGILYDAAGNVISSQQKHGGTALVVSDGLDPTDAFFGLGECSYTGTQTNSDVWGCAGTIQPEPDTVGYTLFGVSSDANDAAAGTGAQSVQTHYLDTVGVEQSVTWVPNGITEVNTGITDCMFVQESHVIAVGTNLVAVGDIDNLAGTGGAVVQRITAGGNQSMSTMKQVPAGKTLVVTGWHSYSTATTTKIADIRLRSTGDAGVASTPGVYRFQDSARLKDNNTGHIPLLFKVPSLATIKVSVWTTGSLSVNARWQGYLEPN